MELNEQTWERHRPLHPGAALSVADIETMARLLAELRELTQSRASHAAASDFLKRFGRDPDDTLVRPERLAN